MKGWGVFEIDINRDQLIANTVLVVIATILVILRFISRRIRESKIWWDDVLCIVASLHLFALLAVEYYWAHIGMRRLITAIPMENTVMLYKTLIVYQILYYDAMVCTKISYLFFYLRIFVSKEFRLATWICMMCAAAYWLGAILQVFLLCQPFEKNWNPTKPGHCANQNIAFSTIGAFNLLTDLMIVFLPVRFIWQLQMNLATKLALFSIFGLGLFIASITIIRIRVLTTTDFSDLPYNMIWAAFWSVTEPALAIGNSCAPMLRPVVKAIFPNLFLSDKVDYYGNSLPVSAPRNLKVDRAKQGTEADGEIPLTRMEDASHSISMYDGSTHEGSQDGCEASFSHRPKAEHPV
ncbi:hypothetical protein N7468_000369 [Penicillium chermesinum]|uniref:Rhodopsin domain-containing protein n=1 Tax=Penicillium chermesinum TaxID=63820 RepID=A0A9W9PLU8_9EURO|nr:uncharacterized protein N7468_000369 [Penicillium chermesinum]KAJ5248918.1 hypothetical protein N7468_000369 [Penicillium chermesinum]KAJ6151020.1 hypothetical protein N7470_007614 [Penicillium chermesinum]